MLQDIHWSGGLIGYFPTYALGNLYAAQFFDQAKSDFGDMDAMFRRGDFQPLREWLRKRSTAKGIAIRPPSWCGAVTGRPLSHEPLMAQLRRKFYILYGINS